MDRNRTLTYVNSSGQEVYLSNPDITRWFELKGRSGFTAPEIEIISQKYANGRTKILKRQLQPRTVTVSMIVMGDSSAERDSVFFEMVSRLMDVNGGNNGKLFVKRSDGMEVYLNCVYSSGLSILEEYRRYHRFTLEFYAPDPYFYKDLEDTYIEVHEGAFLTLSDTLKIGNYHKIGEFISEGSGIINNTSSESLQPEIRLGRVKGSLTITNQDSGYSVKINGMDMTDQQELVIDTRDDSKSIYILNPDGTTIQAGQHLEWSNQDNEFPIVPGENHISYVASVGSKVESLTFTSSLKYLSA